MRKIFTLILIASFFVLGCGPKQITKAYNTLSAANAAYNPSGPILIQISKDWPFEKRKAVERADKILHDAISASWAALYAWKAGNANQTDFDKALNAVLAALDEISNIVDNQTFKDVINAVQKIIQFYLQVQNADAGLFKDFNKKLTDMAEAHQ